jgi:hypothetical protein
MRLEAVRDGSLLPIAASLILVGSAAMVAVVSAAVVVTSPVVLTSAVVVAASVSVVIVVSSEVAGVSVDSVPVAVVSRKVKLDDANVEGWMKVEVDSGTLEAAIVVTSAVTELVIFGRQGPAWTDTAANARAPTQRLKEGIMNE